MKILKKTFKGITEYKTQDLIYEYFKNQTDKAKRPKDQILILLKSLDDIQQSFNHGYERMKGTKFSSDNENEVPIDSFIHRLNGKNIRLKEIQHARDILTKLYHEYTSPPPANIVSSPQPTTEKEKRDKLTKQIFPKLNTKWIAWPDSLQNLGDLIASQKYLYSILPLRKLPDKYGRPVFLEYCNVRTFRQLCFDVLREAANNIEAENDKKHKGKYYDAIKNSSELLQLFEQNSDLMDYDMSFLSNIDNDYSLYNDNWYKLIYEELILIDRKLRELFCIDTDLKITSPPPGNIKLSNSQKALLYFYNDVNVTRDKHGNDIYNLYIDFADQKKRIPKTPKAQNAQIKRIETIMPFIKDQNNIKASRDLEQIINDMNEKGEIIK